MAKVGHVEMSVIMYGHILAFVGSNDIPCQNRSLSVGLSSYYFWVYVFWKMISKKFVKSDLFIWRELQPSTNYTNK